VHPPWWPKACKDEASGPGGLECYAGTNAKPGSLGNSMSFITGVLGIGGAKGRARRLAGPGQLLFVAAALALYELAHLVSSDQRAAALRHARDLLHFERDLGINWEHAVQHLALSSDVVRLLANAVYTWAYWPMLVGALVLLWHRDRRRYLMLRDGMIFSGAVGLAFFLLYPVAPPRMLPGFINTILAGTIDHAIVHGSVADPYAALPSFHAGWFAVAAVVLASWTSRPPVVLLAVVAAAAMALAVVISANHYIIDAASGIGLSFAGVALAAQLRRRGRNGQVGDENPIKYGWEPPKSSVLGRLGG
jgi:PAP2 superfamily